MIVAYANTSSRLNQETHKKIDVYAFAITLFEMVSAESAWNGRNFEEICSAVINGERPALQENNIKSTHPILIEIIRQAWQQNPNDRPDFEEIKSMLIQNCNPDWNITSINVSITKSSIVSSTAKISSGRA